MKEALNGSKSIKCAPQYVKNVGANFINKKYN